MALDSFDTNKQEKTSDIDVRDPDEVADYIAQQDWHSFNDR